MRVSWCCDRSNRLASPGIEVLALDKGPGMVDLGRCLRDGFSTAGSPGNGLGAIIRLSTFTDFYSRPPTGTALLIRLWSRPPPPPLSSKPTSSGSGQLAQGWRRSVRRCLGRGAGGRAELAACRRWAGAWANGGRGVPNGGSYFPRQHASRPDARFSRLSTLLCAAREGPLSPLPKWISTAGGSL